MTEFISDISIYIDKDINKIADSDVYQISQSKITNLIETKTDILDKLSLTNDDINIIYDIIEKYFYDYETNNDILLDNINLLNTNINNDYNDVNNNILSRVRKTNDYMRGNLKFNNNFGIKSKFNNLDIGNINSKFIDIGNFNNTDQSLIYDINLRYDKNINFTTTSNINIGNINDTINIYSTNHNIITDNFIIDNYIILNENNTFNNSSNGIGLWFNNNNNYGYIIIDNEIQHFLFKYDLSSKFTGSKLSSNSFIIVILFFDIFLNNSIYSI